MKYIPYGKQSIDQDDINAVVGVLKSDFLTTGPKVAEFERIVAEYVGAKYAVAVSNGTAALHIACLAAGIHAGDEVIVAPITFAASSNCVLYCGGKPIFADIDPVTYNIDVDDIKRKITKKTRAIIPVDFTGLPCKLDEINKIAKDNNLIVIEDASHALGSDYNGRMIGSISDMTTFSFHPVKHITTGEGGIVTTNSDELYKKLQLFRSHGITRDPDLLQKNEGDWYYEQLELGYNYRITDFQCALGISQLKKLDRFLERRRAIAKKYNDAFSNIREFVIPAIMEGCNSSYHLYVLKVEDISRKKVFNKLRDVGIGVNVHYIPVYKHPYYQNNGYKTTFCKNAEILYEKLISLPIFPDLTDAEQGYIIEQVLEIVKS